MTEMSALAAAPPGEIQAERIADDACRKGFEDILVENMGRLYAVAMNLVKHNRMDAEDLIQDAVLRAFRNRATVESAAEPYAYLRRAVVNTFLTKIRNEGRRGSFTDLSAIENLSDDDVMEIPSVLIENVQSNLWDEEIVKALDRLPAIYRAVFVLSDIEEMTREEISEQLKLSKGTVSSRLFRARRFMAKELEEYGRKRGFGKQQ
ncbi:MAG TPA: RNA polymerase sigma factor [Candidatus Kapabacteria bacterium]|nr:RNA polymerase sigma factor [Candidatus Kapabacteria bacterium]